MNLKSILPWLLLGAGFAISPMAEAAPVIWSLTNLTFEDGATASGTFVWDADSRTMNLWDISVTGGNALPGFTYNPAASFFFAYSAWSSQLTLQFNDNSSNRQLRLTPIADLTDAGLTTNIDLNTANLSGSVECNNCDPARTVTAGAFHGYAISKRSRASHERYGSTGANSSGVSSEKDPQNLVDRAHFVCVPTLLET